jgi:hypothetical protein
VVKAVSCRLTPPTTKISMRTYVSEQSLTSYFHNTILDNILRITMNLPEPLQTHLNQARANIPSNHREGPQEGIVSDPDTAFIHINDWAFLNSHAYVKLSRTVNTGRCRYGCIFHSRKEGQRTQNTCKIEEKDWRRVNSYVRGIGCPIGVTISK